MPGSVGWCPPEKTSCREGVWSQLKWRGGVQMGREEGGGENATPLGHMAPSKPHNALSKPAVGFLPWPLALLLPSPPPLPGLEPSPDSAPGFLLGAQTPSCSGKVGLPEGLYLGGGDWRLTYSAQPKRNTVQDQVCLLSPGVNPETQPSHPQPLLLWGTGRNCLCLGLGK